MKRYVYYCLMSACIGMVAACKNPHTQSADKSAQTETTGNSTKHTVFPTPEIPSVITTPNERRIYLTTHYWDNFDFTDTLLLNNRDVTEQGFVNLISLLSDEVSSPEEINQSFDNLCVRMENHPYARKLFMRLFDDYLYNPNSPLYNEQLYLAYLERMLKSPAIDETAKSSMAFKQKLISRNQPGTLASDFTYYLPNGKAGTLRRTPAKNGKLLLVFYDPECPGCHKIMQEMLHDTALTEAVQKKRLTVLAVYTEGNTKAWQKDLPSLPSGWIIGTDREAIKLHALYDLKAMPSLYLLDGNKKVVLKDAPYSRIRTKLQLQ